jgi:16S rRNA (guanine966-N2)-methyltransferase
VIRGDAFSLAKRGVAGGPFTLLLLDPPYTLDQSEVTEFLDRLAATGALARPCHVAWEHSADTQLVWPSAFRVLTEKRYGMTKVGLAVFEGGAGEQ